jgi:hypothetical protein
MDVGLPNRIDVVQMDCTSKLDANNQVHPETNSTPKTEIDSNTEIQQTANDAAALLQIVTSKLSGAVIRKISASDYMQLLAILNRIVGNSVDDQV